MHRSLPGEKTTPEECPEVCLRWVLQCGRPRLLRHPGPKQVTVDPDAGGSKGKPGTAEAAKGGKKGEK